MPKLDAFEACLQQRCATAAMRIASRICVQVHALQTGWCARKRLCMGTLAAIRGGACSISFSSSYTRRARSSRMIVCTCCGAASKHALAVSPIPQPQVRCGALDHLRWSQRIDPRPAQHPRLAPTAADSHARMRRHACPMTSIFASSSCPIAITSTSSPSAPACACFCCSSVCSRSLNLRSRTAAFRCRPYAQVFPLSLSCTLALSATAQL